jgi:membrane protease subunit (stomatin/prohibitin family)
MDLIDVIEWRDISGQEMVHRWPEYGEGNIRLGAQLTVRESQTAVFFRDGKALDVLGPGRHTLTTENIPLLQRLINIPFDGKTPFQSEVYFVNMKTFTDMKWGTRQPITFRDSELSMVRLRALGSLTVRVSDPQLFVNTVVGTEHQYSQESLLNWMRDFIAARFNDTLGLVMKTILDLPMHYNELAVAVKSRVGDDMAKYGIELIDLVIEAVTPPDEVQKMIDERGSMEALGDMKRYTQYQTAQAIREMPQAGGDGGGMMATGAGLGAGVGIGAAIGSAVGDALRGGGQAPAQPAEPQAAVAAPTPASAGKCAKCGGDLVPNARFCPNCGAPVGPAVCAKCGKELPVGAKFCPECGEKTA